MLCWPIRSHVWKWPFGHRWVKVSHWRHHQHGNLLPTILDVTRLLWRHASQATPLFIRLVQTNHFLTCEGNPPVGCVMTSRITGKSTVYSSCSDRPLPYLWGESTSDWWFPFTNGRGKRCHAISSSWVTPTPRRHWFNINSLWPSDTIWRNITGSTLAQVMACCLTPPSHYINHLWTTINEVLCHSSEGNLTENAHDICTWCEFETKSLHEPMLTDHQRGLVAFIWGLFHRKCSRYLSWCEFENYECMVTVASFRGQ